MDIDYCSGVEPVFKPEFSPNIHRENAESPWHSFNFWEASVVKRGLLKSWGFTVSRGSQCAALLWLLSLHRGKPSSISPIRFFSLWQFSLSLSLFHSLSLYYFFPDNASSIFHHETVWKHPLMSLCYWLHLPSTDPHNLFLCLMVHMVHGSNLFLPVSCSLLCRHLLNSSKLTNNLSFFYQTYNITMCLDIIL